ncbi:MAG: leucine-rich repeat domain-containing protein [Actinobacteria bacterium]|nr:leucine-rich repeat domain-containing protein [Actinomycetota bacterium]MBU3986620.1 leucine-rich repeat domain-containing protein [Actinomycetota bacterium]MBU4007228.1 leucine-rich repeat domain-containing protein [Actinomycetota bacterium]MBU4064981.1 leucine-rich repeat domain-containing protein [Actinomycetota bacterium]MBU4094493.1 leucine-rich repeat domain-containing protein [Actinomycetota bacterium]
MNRSSALSKLVRGSAAMLVSLALGFGYLTVEALPARAEGTVTINDAGFAACLADALSTTGSTFEVVALNALTGLNCDSRGITDLAGAEYLVGATSLSFASNAISSVAPLGALESLESLDISGNHVVDLQPLAGAWSLLTLNAHTQTAEWAIARNVATIVPVRLPYGEQPSTMTSDNSNLTIDAFGGALATVAGQYTITFGGNEYGIGWDFDGVLTTKVVYPAVDVPDANFAACLADELGLLPGSKFSVPMLGAITTLNCDGRGISDLTGAYALSGATSLSFANNNIYSVEPLNTGNFETVTLNISGNHISDLSPLNLEFAAGLTATNQTVSWTIAPNVATAIPLKWYDGQLPTTLTSDSANLTIDAGLATGVSVGSYSITFSVDQYGRNFAGVLTTTVDAGDVTVPDEGLAACLRERLSVSGSVFGSIELAGITGTLNCSERAISDLTGAEALTGVTTLNLASNSLEAADLTSIGSLTGLTTLNLATNQLTGVAALAGNTGLTSLNVSANKITDVSPLAALSLTTLDATAQSLSQTVEAATAADLTIKNLAGELPTFTLPGGVTIDAGQVTAAAGIYEIPFTSGAGQVVYSGTFTLSSHLEVSFLDSAFSACVATSLNKPASTATFSNLDLAGVTSVGCAKQLVRYLDGAEYLTGLVHLDVSGNTISDVTPLAGLKWIYGLDLSDNAISDVSPLAASTAPIQLLNLGGNQISSISALSGFTGLTTLDVSDNKLASLTGTSGMTQLLTLRASNNELTSLPSLPATFTRLRSIEVADNQLTSLAPLASLPTNKLKTLDVSGNQISSISTLSRFTVLNTVLAARNKISDLTPLTGRNSLLSLDFSDNKVSSLNGLASHTLLMTLKLSGNQITDVSDLATLPMLAELQIYDNQIADLSPVSGLASLTYLNARGQELNLAVIPQVATELPMKDHTGAAPTLGELPAGVTVATNQVTAAAEGSYDLSFVSGDYATTNIEYSGTLKVTATYNTFTAAPTPTITGTAKVDSTLTAHPGTWTPTPTLAYQWQADGADISGAAEASYQLTANEVGKAITVVVTGSKDTYATIVRTSVATEAVAQGTFTAPDKITVTGRYTAGETLTASGAWTPTPDTVSYQWLRDGVAIENETNSTYLLTDTDIGLPISVQVSVTKAGYPNDSLTSAAKVVAEGVTIPDVGLYSCLSEAVGSYPVVFRSQDLAALTSLDCSYRNISDLTGLDALTGLTSLNLGHNSLVNLAPLGTLTGLTSLDLESNSLANLAELSTLTGLTSLDASNNVITDISGLSALADLTTLDLGDNRITTITALSGMTELTLLTLSNNWIADLTPLAGLTGLTYSATGQIIDVNVESATATPLGIKYIDGALPDFVLPTGVTIENGDVTAAAGLYSITFVNAPASEGAAAIFSGTVSLNAHVDVAIPDSGFAACLADQLDLPAGTSTFSNIDLAGISDLSCARRMITSIEGAQYLTGAVLLDFSRNAIADITPLTDLSQVVSLDLSDNNFASLAPLSGHVNLQNLYANGNVISDLSPLAALASLKKLNVSDNQLHSLEGLEGLTNILEVQAASNQLTTLAPLATQARLTTIDVSDNQLTSIDALSTSPATTRLKSLDISGNLITSISAVSRFTKLATLRAHNNKISDLTPLAGLSQLLEVDFTSNQLSSLTGLSGHSWLLIARLSDNQITGVSALSGSTSLVFLEAYNNQIADLSPLAGLSFNTLNVRGQVVPMAAVPQVATALPLKDSSSAVPSLGSLPAGVSVAADELTADAEGVYDVTFSSGDFATTYLEFSGTLKVTAAYNTFTAAPTPTITGTAKVDSTLTANVGTWAPEPAFAYQWQADGTDISGATAQTYQLTANEASKSISVVVTATLDTYAATVRPSAATQPVALATFTAPAEIAVSGAFKVGGTLTAAAGTWTPTATTTAYQWLRAGVAIDGATDATYTLTTADLDQAVSVQVSVAKDGYLSASLHSSATVVGLGTMVGDKPVIVVDGGGQIAIGKTLNVGTGYWAPSPTFALQWYRAGYAIDGATGYSYQVTAADVGKAITVAQTGSATGYASLTKLSDPTAEVPAGTITAPSTISVAGSLAVGQTLVADPGSWTPTPDALSYQWLSGGDAIPAATSASYRLTAADEGQVITVRVSASKAGYASATAASVNSTEVAKGTFVTVKPVITGTATFGQTLKATVDPWSPTANLSWQWLRDGSDITGATGSNYQLVSADIGKVISVRVLGSLAGYYDGLDVSEPSAAVAAATFSAPASVAVTGDAAVGETLQVAAATWTPTPDAFSYRWLRDGVVISGATSSSYALVADDLAKVVTVEVTAVKTGYTDLVLTSADGDPVAASAFTADVPTISGNAVVDSTLTAHAGTWAPTPTSLTCAWLADGVAIDGATDATFVVTAAEAGKAITVEVSGAKGGYADKTVTSAATATVAAAELTGPDEVSVAGSFVVGQTLTADAGTWTPAPVGVGYQWLRAGVAIDGATDAAYELTAADAGKIITVKVTAAKVGYRTVTLRSVAADPVAAASFVPATPVISGTATVGSTLTAEVGTWAPVPSALAYQWRRDGRAIEDATSETYEVSLADVGKAITVSVTGSAVGYADETATSDPTSLVPAGTFTGPAEIMVNGDLIVGETLSADVGSWSPTPDSFSYQWLRGGEPIKGATEATRKLTGVDDGAQITVEVTASRYGYEDLSRTSTAGGTVAKGNLVTEVPTIVGQGQVGRTLTANPGNWTPTPESWSYQWFRDGVAIYGETGATYLLTTDDINASITVEVSGTLAGYNTSALVESDPVAVDPAGRFDTPEDITVAGAFAVGNTLSASAGTWTPAAESYGYQWLRSGVAIDGATASTYRLAAADLGKVVTVKVTGAKAGYVTASVRSSAPSAVGAGSFAAGHPVLGGIPRIGQVLTVSAGSWSPTPATLTYQWYRSGSPIRGAVGTSYRVVAADVWKTITVSVTARLDGYAQTSVISNASTAVPLGVLAGPNPSISGKVKVKKKLTAKIGTWSPKPDRITYQWYRSGKVIKKATKATYKLTKSDKGKKITVKVTVVKAGYATRVVISKSTAKVKK